MIDPRLPVDSLTRFLFDGFRVDRVTMRAGVLPANPGREFRIIATLGSAWELHARDGGIERYARGESCLLPVAFERRARFLESGENLLISVDDQTLTQLAADAGAPELAHSFQFQRLRDPMVSSVIHALARELQSHQDRPSLYARSLVTTLLGHLVRGQQAGDRERVRDGGLSAATLHELECRIDANLALRLDVDYLARSLNLSASYFAHAFKKATARTPHCYVTERRISAARALLSTTDLPIGDIARRVGFPSQSHFSATFQAQTGTTPSAHRG